MVVAAAMFRRGLWRGVFLYSDAQTFCIELCKEGLEGLCTCVYGTYHTVIPERAHCCLGAPYYPSQKYFQNPVVA